MATPRVGSVPAQTWLERPMIAEIVVSVMAALAFVRTLAFQFVYDDRQQIVENAAIKSWSYLPQYFTSHVWTGLESASEYYRPLFLLWLRVNDALFGLKPWGWHLTSVLCHVVVALLVFAVARKLTNDPTVAFVTGLVFAVHPVHIESVAWVSGITDPLMAAFLLGSFLAYLKGSDRIAWRVLSWALFALALLTKETAAAYAIVVLVHATMFAENGAAVQPASLTRRIVHAVKQGLPFLVIVIAYLLVRAHVLHGMTNVNRTGWETILLTLPSVTWMYVRHLLVPAGLSGFYGMPFVTEWQSAAFLVPLVLLVVVLAVVIWRVSKMEQRSLGLFAFVWFALFLLPALYLKAFTPGDIAHDRYLYLPSFAFALLLALGIKSFASDWKESGTKVALAVALMVGAAYFVGTVVQQRHWADGIKLYTRSVDTGASDKKALNNLANELALAGQADKAMSVYERLLATDPANALTNYNLGYTYYRMHRMTEAETYLRRAAELDPKSAEAAMYLGVAQFKQGRAADAEKNVRRAIQLNPTKQGYHFTLAVILAAQQNKAAAEQEFREEMKYHPETTATVEQQIKALREEHPGN